jgi:HPt (histidine-containing phosphotransfer) domain-containing protein
MMERVDALRSACEALGRNPADLQARGTGREAAHKLSGSLGVFGLPQGSELAAELERILKPGAPLNPQIAAALPKLIEELQSVIDSKQA